MSGFLSVRVAAVTEAAARIRLYELVPVDGTLPPFAAGAHVTVRLPSGTERQYSLCNDPAERDRYVVGVLRCDDGRGGSVEMHERVRAGDTLEIRPPLNNFPLDAGPGASLLVAGGIGATPILAMARALAREGRDFRLVYLARSPEEAAFLPDLEGFGDRVSLFFDGSDPARRFDIAGLLAGADAGRHLYCCGPTGMMAAVAAASAHWPSAQVHFEHFTNAEVALRAGDGGFTVRLARRGVEVRVGAEETMLDALLAAGHDVDYSCCEGTCGTCIARVLDGEPDHRDAVLTEAERARGDQIAVCCSRARGPLIVLDL